MQKGLKQFIETEKSSRTKVQKKTIEQKPRKSLLLQGTITVLCPRLQEKVNAKVECANCKYFSHVAYEGMFGVLIACSYGVDKHES